jgi:hypothetical protein
LQKKAAEGQSIVVCDESFLLCRVAEKRRILARDHDGEMEMIAKPKGTVGTKGYSLIKNMQLDPKNEEEKGLYSDILVSV